MKFLKYIISFFAFMATVGCNDDHMLQPTQEEESGDKITIDLSLNMAEMIGTQTRAFADDPDYANLKLYVLEFELRDANDPWANNLSQNYTADIENEAPNTTEGYGDIHYKITLNKTDQPRVLHFIAVPSTTELNIGFGSEASLIPQLQLDNSTPAYWNRIEFPNGYGSYDQNEKWTNIEGLEEMFNHVPMLCNFAKISLEVANNAGFTLDGFALINRPSKGTVCPWISNSEVSKFPDFLNGSSLKSYDAISADYSGYWPFNQVTDVEDKTPSDALFTTASKYLYEHPHTSLNSPLILIRGRKTGNNTIMYYKLDLGKTDEDNLFQFYNILRNFEYQITITEIGADGYTTAAAAMNGVVYNNFSFDVNTRNMLNVSDGNNMLWVNQTTFVVTSADDTTIHFLYRFKENIGSGGGTVANGTNNIGFKDLDEGEAITGIEYGTTDDADGWREITIQTVEPTATRKSQEFIIYDKKTGLGRTIRIIVRTPWNYSNPTLYGVNYDTYAQYQTAIKDYSKWLNVVSSQTETGATIGGEPLTIGFVIENDIPEAMFPLEFVFEADPQNIENNKLGNLLVQTGKSLYETVTTTRIKYVKTVTWLDYNTELSDANPTGAQVTLDDGSIIHFVRGRFLTMASITGTTNKIRVYNPYMQVRKENADGTVSVSKYIDFTFTPFNEQGPNLAN